LLAKFVVWCRSSVGEDPPHVVEGVLHRRDSLLAIDLGMKSGAHIESSFALLAMRPIQSDGYSSLSVDGQPFNARQVTLCTSGKNYISCSAPTQDYFGREERSYRTGKQRIAMTITT
jgi:hypothetical protein